MHVGQILGDAGPLAGSPHRARLRQRRDGAAWPGRSSARSGSTSTAIGVEPDGRNINLNCGSTHLEALWRPSSVSGARLGIAFDGDGDRALFVDPRGRVVDGDAVLLMAADTCKREGRLPSDAWSRR